jgi:hypothetical protein
VVGGDLGGVHPVRAAGEDEHRAAPGVEEQAVRDGADLAAERLGGERRGVHRVGEDDDAAGAAGLLPGAAEAGDGGVLERGVRHAHTLGGG